MTVLPFKAFKAHVLLSRAPFSVILVPKFSDFIILSIHALIHNNWSLHYIYVYCVLALGNPILEPPFEDFQEQAFEESEVFFSGQQDKCH
jgi:hypothetical protein